MANTVVKADKKIKKQQHASCVNCQHLVHKFISSSLWHDI